MIIPFTGFCEGLHMGIGMSRVPTNNPVVVHSWVTTACSYFGNGHDEHVEVSCGSAVLDKNGFIVSFFRTRRG